MPDLTAKVFRTYNASYTLENELKKFESQVPAEDRHSQVKLKLFYDECNKKVAILCNHQKGESKNHGEQVEKLTAKVVYFTYF